MSASPFEKPLLGHEIVCPDHEKYGRPCWACREYHAHVANTLAKAAKRVSRAKAAGQVQMFDTPKEDK